MSSTNIPVTFLVHRVNILQFFQTQLEHLHRFHHILSAGIIKTEVGWADRADSHHRKLNTAQALAGQNNKNGVKVYKEKV